MIESFRRPRVEDYEPLVGGEAIDRLRRKAEPLRGCRVADVNSTYYGGGVAELLQSSTMLLDDLGLKSEWRVIAGPPEFFSVTKKIHNALQGAPIHLTDQKRQVYEETIFENSVWNDLEHDFVIVHDPQPLPLVRHYRRRGPWLWRCHVDLTAPHPALWAYLHDFVRLYDAVILTLEEYARRTEVPQFFRFPAIDPFALKNRDLDEREVDERLAHYKIPTDRPLVVQVSRFDRWKDPEGVIRAFQLARREVECTLVLLGNVATDDPEGHEVFEKLLARQSERLLVLSHQDGALVNALQRRAAVVLQKSTREGFGLTVTEAMWKGAAVVGGNCGGIRHQIEDGVSGFLVDDAEQAADRIVRLIRDPDLRRRLGLAARETVRRRFLMTRVVEELLDIFTAFEMRFRLRPGAVATSVSTMKARPRREHAPKDPRTVG